MELTNQQPSFDLNRHSLMWGALATVLVINLADAGLTLWAVHMGWAVEANPFMAHVLDLGSIPFVLTKIFLVSSGVMLLWMLRSRTLLAAIGSFAVLGTYLYVLSCHMETFRYLMG
ncbi:MAG: hypothetical protein IPJ88_14930 [Myxococcales bacterium]|nr:MAG: hypothetical protein IPJ88_14930 [Myxococcales bacterium]